MKRTCAAVAAAVSAPLWVSAVLGCNCPEGALIALQRLSEVETAGSQRCRLPRRLVGACADGPFCRRGLGARAARLSLASASQCEFNIVRCGTADGLSRAQSIPQPGERRAPLEEEGRWNARGETELAGPRPGSTRPLV